MILKIKFPSDLKTDMLLDSDLIPCFCKVSDKFELVFEHVVSKKTIGLVEDWCSRELSLRAPAGGGGEYTFYCYGLISLVKKSDDIYLIKELRFFTSPGWCPIIVDTEYGPLGYFFDEDIE